MSAIQGLSSAGFYSAASVSRASFAPRTAAASQASSQSTLEADLSLSGLKAGVSTHELLLSIQASIKDAVNDPSNSNKDVLEVIQNAIMQTLQDNGVDPDKLSQLLQQDQQTNQTYGSVGQNQGDGSFRGSREGGRPHGPPPQGGPPPGGPPPGGPPPGGPPPGGPPPGGPPPGSSSGSSPNGTDSSTDATSSTSDDDSDPNDDDSDFSAVFASTIQSTNFASDSTGSTVATQTASSTLDTGRLKSQFEQLVANFIKSLPSGSLLDLKA